MIMIFHINQYSNEPKYTECQMDFEWPLASWFTALLPLLLCIVDQCDPAKYVDKSVMFIE